MKVANLKSFQKAFVVALCVISHIPTGFASIPERQRSIPLEDIAPIKPFDYDQSVARDFFMDYFPVSQISPTNDTGKLQDQIRVGLVMKSMDKFFNGDFFKKTPVGQIAHEVKEAASQEVTVSTGSTGIQHKVGFDIKALEKQAVFHYDGYLNGRITYYAETKVQQLAFAKTLGTNTTLTLTNDSPVGEFIPGGNLNLTYSF